MNMNISPGMGFQGMNPLADIIPMMENMANSPAAGLAKGILGEVVGGALEELTPVMGEMGAAIGSQVGGAAGSAAGTALGGIVGGPAGAALGGLGGKIVGTMLGSGVGAFAGETGGQLAAGLAQQAFS